MAPRRALVFFALLPAAAATTDDVNVFVGTSSTGNTFPGSALGAKHADPRRPPPSSRST